MPRAFALALLGSAVLFACNVKIDVNTAAENVDELVGDWSGTCQFSDFDLAVEITDLAAVDEDELSGSAIADLDFTGDDGAGYAITYTGTVDTLVTGSDFTMAFDIQSSDGLDGSFTIEGDTSADPLSAVCLSGGQAGDIELIQD